MQPQTRRRHLLRLAGLAATATLAGCGGDGDGDGDGGDGGGGYGGGDDSDSAGDGGGTDGDGDGDTSEDSSDGNTDDGATATTTGTATPTDAPGTDELDLREANVVGVEFAGGDGSYDFDVTLHHDDDGEEGYANWWQVERLDGTQLGRRDLAHPHSRQPFTRSSLSPFDIPADVTCVVVRCHDQTHGYGGRAVLVNLDSGATRGILQGADPQSFGAGDCP
ncbi:MAG: hypothetical protein BRD23_08780 [Halobacteriales archaeon SW_9_67_25]|nr:MAG: hypothetical protein BRD23_08780 [Halobacteriales archaeon SW_9_67_25]